MEDHPAEVVDDVKIEFTDLEIFTQIWMFPRLVFRYLNEYRYDKFLYIILVLAGIVKGFDRAVTRSSGDTLSLTAIILLSVFAGGALTWISVYLYAGLISWTGAWLNGRSNTSSIFRVVGYSMIPTIVAGLLLIPQIAVFGIRMFQSDFDVADESMSATILYYFSFMVELTFGIWSFVILCVGISEVQKIPVGKAIVNILLPAVIIIVPLGIIAFLLSDIF